MEARTTLVLYTRKIKAATAEIVHAFGAVTIRLSNFVFVASMPPNFDVRRLTLSSPNPPENIDELSITMLENWNAMKEKDLLRTPLDRLVSLESRGVAAMAVVIEKDVPDDAFQYVLAGAHSLAETYAKEPYANKKLTFVFKQFLVDPPIILGPPSVPPQLEMPPAVTPQPKVHISSWPSAVPFNDKLYCFYRGRSQTQSLFFDIYNGSSWAGEQQGPPVVIHEGPSAVHFQNILYCFLHGANDWIWYTSFNGTTWNKPQQVPETRISAGPSAIVVNNKIYLFHQGLLPTNQLWFNVFNGDEWGKDTQALGSAITGSPSAVVFNNLIYCFYQGAQANAKVLMVNVLNPTTGVWEGQKPIPNTSRMSQGPSTIVVEGLLYCFYQGESAGELYANVTADGVVWGKERLIENIGVCEGLGTAEFKNKLVYLFQKGEGGKVKDGELWYRELKLAERSITPISQGEPSLKSLGYEEGYRGFAKLAADMKKEVTADPDSESFGYVLYITEKPILYEAFADKIRMYMQYKEPSYMHQSFAKIFAAEGTYDQRILKNLPGFPPRPSSENEPSYTMAWMIDWKTFLENAQLIVFHRAYETDKNPQLWVLFMDKRNSRWVEIEGPRMSARNKLVNGAPAPQFGPSSILYIFYHAEANQEMRYNMLGISNPNAEKVWDVEKVMHDIQGSNTPSAISLGNFMHVFHTGPSGGDEFRYTTLDLRVNQWGVDHLAFKVANNVAPSAVLFKGKIYAFSKGNLINRNKIEVSIWDPVNLTWDQPKDINPASDHNLAGEPTAVVRNNRVYVFYVSDGQASVWWNQFDGATWHGPTRVNMSYPNVAPMDQGIGAYGWGDHIHCFFRGRSNLDTQFVYYKVLNTKDLTWNAEVVLPTASGFSSKPGVILNHLIIGTA